MKNLNLLSSMMFVSFCFTTGSYAQRWITVEDMADRILRQTVTGVTVIVHGYQFSDSDGASLLPLATDIYNAIPGPGWLLFYELYEDGDQAAFDANISINVPGPNVSGQQGHLVLLFSWAPESNEDDSGWAEAAGDALFSLIVRMGLANPVTKTGVPMHFIAHSFGTGVVSECVERLAKYEIAVDQVTYLDAHDFDQAFVPIDGSQRIWTLGSPPGYGASVWNNVAFADSYYQTRGVKGRAIVITLPNGRPIPGCYNYFVSAELPPPSQTIPPWNPYGNSSESDHSWIWKVFYRGSVLGQIPPDTVGSIAPPQQMPDWGAFGWAYSRFNPNQIARPNPTFFNAAPPAAPTQDHVYSERQIANANGTPNTTGLNQLGLTAARVTQGRWSPLWKPNQLYNGKIDHNGRSLFGGGSVIPGWSHHGGGGTGYVSSESGGNEFILLKRNYNIRTHNRMFIPHDANRLVFKMRRVAASQLNTLDIYIGDRNHGLLSVMSLRTTDARWVTKAVSIHPHLRGKVNTLTFELYAHDGNVDAEVWIDDVKFDGSIVLGAGMGKTRATNALAGINQVENPLEWSRRNFSDGATQQVYGFYPNYSLSNGVNDEIFGTFQSPHTLVQMPVSFDFQILGSPATIEVPRSLYRAAGSYTNRRLAGNHSVIGTTWIKYELDNSNPDGWKVSKIKILPWKVRTVLQQGFSDVNAPSRIDVYVASEDTILDSSPVANSDWRYVGSVSKSAGTILNVCEWSSLDPMFGVIPESTKYFLSGDNAQSVAFWDDPENDLWHSVINLSSTEYARYIALVFPSGNQYGADPLLHASNNTSTSLQFTDLTNVTVYTGRADHAPGDVNGDGCVNDEDLLMVLFAFGTIGSDLFEDLNGDGSVDDEDLLEVLFMFGEGC